MDFLKRAAGIMLAGIVALAVLAGAISWWSSDPATRDHVIAASGRAAAWIAVVLALPWASFLLVARVEKIQSNAAAAALIAAYTLLELLWLAWLFHFSIAGSLAITAVAAAGLFAAVYNLFACDWIAEKV
jgi:FtsH-binding integral membrane protein